MHPPDSMPTEIAERFADSKLGWQAVARLRTAFNRSRHPMLIADDQRRLITGNAGAYQLLEISQEEIPWRRMDDFTHPNERAKLDRHWQEFLSTGAVEGWYPLYLPDRGPLPIEFSGTAHVLPGRHLALFVAADARPVEQAESTLAREAAWEAVVAEDERSKLTQREREVMTLVAAGLTSGDMGERLFLSTETVKSHVQNAMGKLGSHTRAHAVAIALMTGQIDWEL